jgi:hypothetical protein
VIFFFLIYFQEHTGRVFRLQFDEFQIVSSSHDDTILIWDFLNCAQKIDPHQNHSPSREYYFKFKKNIQDGR